MNTEDQKQIIPTKKKKSRGLRFKKKHGYSLTLHKLMLRVGLITPEIPTVDAIIQYKLMRKKRKGEAKKAKRVKHAQALAGRGAKGNRPKFVKESTGSGGKKR